MDVEQYLNDRVKDQIEWYGKKSQFNQRWFKRLRIAEIFCAALIPFLAGYMHIYQKSMTFTIGALGVVITAISGLLGLHKFQENWIEYRTTCESLKKEKYLFSTCSSPYDCSTEERFQILVNRVESLISKENTNWGQYIVQPPKEVKKD